MEITTNLVLHGTQINKGSVNRGHVFKDPEAEAKLTLQGGITVFSAWPYFSIGEKRKESTKGRGQRVKTVLSWVCRLTADGVAAILFQHPGEKNNRTRWRCLVITHKPWQTLEVLLN